ncbi:kunitz-type protease inhibitor 2 isoform X2 [Antechinus flavipes]|uniref:kunitz-type protease inhibitor 2 isoform X2 n=1 Tax=Antechinus flavipes TaxID=38775 RepID=UPI00223629E5|nr:kunitz-type protease inhibitor 2 isoform X2 [Antechinus flavipes]
MRQQLLRGPPLSSVLLVLLGALLLTGAAWGLDDHPASPSGAKEQPGLQDLCRSPKMVGRCRASIPRWWYNVTAQACHSFLYGGCGGNYNNFLTRKDCIKACNGVAAPRKQNSEEFPVTDFDYEEYCTAKAVTGPCRAAFPRWYFDAEKNTCVHFIYGGCRGNKNSYVNLEDCMTKCFGKRTHKASHPAMSHSTKAVALAVLLAVMAAILLGAMVVIFIKIARKHRASAFNTVWSPIDDKEYLVKSAYTI